eukprot:PhM_4_TR4969/c0_g1_i1/m.27642/K19998/SCFD1, SLY1; sec1 family domain-containing protein 1
MSDFACLKSIARDSVIDMFSCGASGAGAQLAEVGVSDASWKVLIYDSAGRDILAPLIKVKDLREYGITLHLKVDAQRQSVPEAPAMYFLLPTEQNVKLISEDILQSRYASYRINFLKQCPRRILEELAHGVVAMPSVSNIYVGDRPLNFIALEQTLFSLHMEGTFRTMNSRNMTDSAMEDFVESVADGIQHVVGALGVVPIVAAMKTGVSEEVSKRVVSRIQDSLRSNSVASAAAALGTSRPVLLIADRNNDIASALGHPFGYGELLADLLGMTLNKVDLPESGKQPKRQVEVDESDPFWSAHSGKDFSAVCDLVEEGLVNFRKEKAQMEQPVGDDMASLIATAPQLAEKKRYLDSHTSLSHVLLSKIKDREYDAYHAVALDILAMRHGSHNVDMEHFTQLVIAADKKGTVHDRLRLLCLYLICADTEAEFAKADGMDQRLAQLHPAQGDDIAAAVKFIKNIRRWQQGGGSGSSSAEQSHWSWLDKKLSSAAKNIAQTLTGSGEVELLPLTRIVDAILSGDAAKQTNRSVASSASDRQRLLDAVTFTDAKSRQQVDVTNIKITNCVVVVVGGASYAEYYNLQAWKSGKDNSKKSVIYGGTEIVTGEELVKQLVLLGSE